MSEIVLPVSADEEIMTQSLPQLLIDRFNREGVTYCHWKSKSLVGEQDIDLLVSGDSLACATSILMQLGFKAAAPRWGSNPLSVIHYYGYDPDQNELIHLHMFTRVLTGERFLKSHLFPFEEMLLANTYSIDGLAVTSKEAELVLFVLKTFVRYGSFLDVVALLKDDKDVQEEAQLLKAGSNISQAMILLEKYCPVVGEEFFIRCLNAIVNGASFAEKWKLSYQMRRRLRIYRKYSFLGWLFGHIELLMGSVHKKIRKQKGSKVLLSGGAIISIVGADATGKSTLVSETSRWLRKNFVLKTIHAGKPPSTILTVPINVLLGFYRRLKGRSKSKHNKVAVSASDLNRETEEIKGFGSLIYAIRAVSLAWDRRALLLDAKRSVANGEIVVCDRYPTRAIGMMDSPRLKMSMSQKKFIPSLCNKLAKIEQTIYRQIPPPDIVLRLRVSLEVAKQRNAARETVDDEIYLQNRHEQAKEWSMTGIRSLHDIDTDPPLADTIRAVKQAIWRSL